MSIDFSVEEGLGAAWDEPRIGRLVDSIISRELPEAADWLINLHLVTDETIRKLNSDHRGIDARTDVLSFPLLDPADTGFVVPAGQPVHLGDVVISYPRAVEQAHDFCHSLDREVAYLVAHGVLHILGYDHENDVDRERMRAMEEAVLQPLGFTR